MEFPQTMMSIFHKITANCKKSLCRTPLIKKRDGIFVSNSLIGKEQQIASQNQATDKKSQNKGISPDLPHTKLRGT